MQRSAVLLGTAGSWSKNKNNNTS